MQFLYVYCVHTPCIKSWGNNNRFLKAVRYGYGAEISHSHSISDVVLANELSWVEPIWVKLSQIGPNWARLSRVEPSWAELSQVELLFLLLILHWYCVMPYTIALQQKLGQWIFCVRLTHVYSTDLLHWHDGSASKVGFSMHAQDTKKENG